MTGYSLPQYFYGGINFSRHVSIFSLFQIVKEQNTSQHTVANILLSIEIPDYMVELSGIEPLTSCVQGRRSPS